MQYIIATHGQLAAGYENTVEMLTHFEKLHAICAYGEENFPENLVRLLDSFDEEEQILLFADLLGGSVCQEAVSLMDAYPNLHVIAGMNLALVLEVIISGLEPGKLDEAVEHARDQIVNIKQNQRLS